MGKTQADANPIPTPTLPLKGREAFCDTVRLGNVRCAPGGGKTHAASIKTPLQSAFLLEDRPAIVINCYY